MAPLRAAKSVLLPLQATAAPTLQGLLLFFFFGPFPHPEKGCGSPRCRFRPARHPELRPRREVSWCPASPRRGWLDPELAQGPESPDAGSPPPASPESRPRLPARPSPGCSLPFLQCPRILSPSGHQGAPVKPNHPGWLPSSRKFWSPANAQVPDTRAPAPRPRPVSGAWATPACSYRGCPLPPVFP